MSAPRPDAPPNVREIARTLEQAGHETWAVGGAVRDVLLGRPSGDWDLATRARPAEVRRIFKRTVPIGVEHGTVGVLAKDGTMYEVTTFRRDVETDGRHAVVVFADTIQEDLSRRDFTMNAIAWHPLREEMLDLFGGVADMNAGTLRTVGVAQERFQEDYLRVLRAMRFAGLFGLEIEVATWGALCVAVDQLRHLSAERVRDELVKILDADPAPRRSLELYAASGALAVLYPELYALRSGTSPARDPVGPVGPVGDLARASPDGAGGSRAWELSMETVQALPSGRPLLRLAALVRELEPRDAVAMLMRLRLSNAQADETAHRAGAAPLPPPEADDRAFRRWLSLSGQGRLAALARLDLARAYAQGRLEAAAGSADGVDRVVASWRRARAVRAAKPPLEVGSLALDGRGLIQLGLKPGPHFGRILDALLDWVLDDPARNRGDLLEERALELAAEESGRG
jgi:tRNA nucleotidyltransferase (CCA-adding enzyme)